MTYQEYITAVEAAYGQPIPDHYLSGGEVGSVLAELHDEDQSPEDAAAKLSYWHECRKADQKA